MKKVDMMAFPLVPIYARTRVIDFAIHFEEDPMAALIPPPTQGSKLKAIAKPFEYPVT